MNRYSVVDQRRIVAAVLGGAAAVPAFAPTDVSGLVLWLKADAGTFQDDALTTAASADDAKVGGWVDQSTAGNTVTIADTSKRPTLKLNILNGKPAVRFAGSNTWLIKQFGSAYTQPLTIFALGTASDKNAYWFDVDGSGTNRVAIIFNSAAQDNTYLFAGAGFQYNFSLPLAATIYTGIVNGASSYIYFNGSQVATGNAGTNSMGGVTLGARFTLGDVLNGDLYEILVYDAGLSVTDINRVGNYLNTRWGITWTNIT